MLPSRLSELYGDMDSMSRASGLEVTPLHDPNPLPRLATIDSVASADTLGSSSVKIGDLHRSVCPLRAVLEECLWCMRRATRYLLGGGYPPPPLYKLRSCPSYSRRRDRINLGPNFNPVPNVVQPHKTWVS